MIGSNCGVTRRPGRAAALAVSLGALLLAGCSNNGKTTNLISNTMQDCGLVFSDLTGSWHVTLASGLDTLIDCTGLGASGHTVTVPGTAFSYTNVTITADTTASAVQSGVGYQVVGAGLNRANELIANVEADSCLAQFQVWINADNTYVQCLGTFDRASRTISASCDSAEFDSDLNGSIDTFCSLNSLISASVLLN